MKLILNPAPSGTAFAHELQLVIAVQTDVIPEIYYAEDLAKPDRHLLLGMVQSIDFAVRENDREMVDFLENCEVILETTSRNKNLTAELLIARDIDGNYNAVVIGPKEKANTISRAALRYFTGTIRLDIP